MDRWQQIETLFHEALEVPTGQRSQWIDERCGDDKELRDEVEALLTSDQHAEPFFSDALGKVLDQFTFDDSASRIGQNIGAYRLVREIGHGGMGTVYLAHREQQFQQEVAIKLIRRGMDTDALLKRFRRERQILASLNHRNIASIFDGGSTADGLPYFVMEYIDGEPIVNYCEIHKLTIEERLRLFCDVCAAVHHAHQKLVIHRDIKSGNILVTKDRVAKLLDFGVARLLEVDPETDQPTQTQTAARLMTPDYASPEQVRGDALTTATDIYSLGVLLYEMLCGQRPYRLSASTPTELEKAICLNDPPLPSHVASPEIRRQLRGDLDNVVLMAMRKEPSRRYGSAEQFADDIHRYLSNRPVSARKDTLRYRVSKVIRRNKGAAVAAAVFIATLVAGLIATTVTARIAQRERAIAERRFNDLRRFARSTLFELHDAIEPLSGSTAARGVLVKQALEYLNSVNREAGSDPELQRELAISYRRVGDVQGSRTMPNLGNTPGALDSYRKSLALCEQLVKRNPSSILDRREAAIAYVRVSSILQTEGDTKGALEQVQKALAMRQEIAAADPENLQYQADLAAGYQDAGMVLSDREDWPAAVDQFRRSLAIRVALAGEASDLAKQRSLAIAYRRLGAALARAKQPDEALTVLRQGLAIEQAAVSENPGSVQARLDQSFTEMEIGYTLAGQNQLDPAIRCYRTARALRQSVVRDDPTDARARGQLGITCQRLGMLLVQAGQPQEALPDLEKSVTLHADLSTEDPASVVKQAQAAVAYADLGFGHQTMAERTSQTIHWRAASAHYRRSLELQQQLRSRGQDHWLLQRPNHTHANQLRERISVCDQASSAGAVATIR